MLNKLLDSVTTFFEKQPEPQPQKVEVKKAQVEESTTDEDDIIFLRSQVLDCFLKQAMPNTHQIMTDTTSDMKELNDQFLFDSRKKRDPAFMEIIHIHRHRYVINYQRENFAFGYFEHLINIEAEKLKDQYLHSAEANKFYPHLGQLRKYLTLVKPKKGGEFLKYIDTMKPDYIKKFSEADYRRALDKHLDAYKKHLSKYTMSLVVDAGTLKATFLELQKLDELLKTLYSNSIRDLAEEKIEAVILHQSESKIRVPWKTLFIEEFEKKKRALIEAAKSEEYEQQKQQKPQH